MSGWQLRQLTFDSDRERFHSHSYYDIPVLDPSGRKALVHRMSFAERRPRPTDEVTVGIVDVDQPGSWQDVAQTTAWSWQQGPMAQWVGNRLVYNDREEGEFVARLRDSSGTLVRTLPAPIYALNPNGQTGYALNMSRLDALRPGYGYVGGVGKLSQRKPRSDGVWAVPLNGSSQPVLVLSLHRAVGFLFNQSTVRARLGHIARRFWYWFNHVKVSPDGRRFTVKLRWRQAGRGWHSGMGVSLTCGVDGTDLRLLALGASHVNWLNQRELYAYLGGHLWLLRDQAPLGVMQRTIGPSLITQNVHFRHLPPAATEELGRAVFDTPYRERVQLFHYDDRSGEHQVLAEFGNHLPTRGEFRCDLHPCPSADGTRVLVTSLDDGGRQVYLLSRESLR